MGGSGHFPNGLIFAVQPYSPPYTLDEPSCGPARQEAEGKSIGLLWYIIPSWHPPVQLFSVFLQESQCSRQSSSSSSFLFPSSQKTQEKMKDKEKKKGDLDRSL